MFAFLIFGAVALLVALVVFVATRPDTFTVERSALISATPEQVFPLVNDFKNWKHWSPWDKKDPGMTMNYGGSESGEGATYSWSGDKNVGQGGMTITDIIPNEKITIHLEFMKPMKATNTAVFTFQPKDGNTLVTWSMEGNNNFMGKAFSLFMDMDRMVGGDFEEGLSALNGAVKSPE